MTNPIRFALHLPSYLACAGIEGASIVLDLRSGEFLFLDEVTTAFWNVLLDPDLSDLDRECVLKASFDADPVELKEDFENFRADCLTKGLLIEAAPAPRSGVGSTRPAPLIPILSAWISLVTVAVGLRRSGFAPVYERIMADAPAPSLGCDLARAERAFAAAENMFVSRSAPHDCLARSLALFRFLRAMGVSATHVIGVERYSLNAHAWVECEGEVILDLDRRESLIPMRKAPL